ncbi:MAG: hypothetical protein K2R93_18840 [Gemmatimonadaceae bacterium]|nr:hypothetical protein [Gemmatimonadaceae bacterium]
MSHLDLSARWDPFLIYDPRTLLNLYGEESTMVPGLPYTILWEATEGPTTAVSWDVELDRTLDFAVEWPVGDWHLVASAGYESLLRSRRISDNEDLVRVARLDVGAETVSLVVQRAAYHEQARSNLILDYRNEGYSRVPTLRQLMAREHGRMLPSLGDRRLANTIGVCLLLLFKEEGEPVPYLTYRAPNLGVFPSAIHCSAGGAVRWSDDLLTRPFLSILSEQIQREMVEELGISPLEVTD